MHYKELVDRLAAQTGLKPKDVRSVLFALPDILIGLGEGEQVRVPFGVFRMTKRKERTVTIPTSDEAVDVPSEMVVKFRAGTRLRHKAH
jgi:nucleoid DNA-binding protein